jgi:hypothetical protein
MVAMNARITPNRHELPTNNTHEVFSSASKRAHELPPTELLRTVLRKKEGQGHALACPTHTFLEEIPMKIEAPTKRRIEKALRANGFGHGTSKKIVSVIAKALEEKTEEPMRGKGNEDRP